MKIDTLEFLTPQYPRRVLSTDQQWRFLVTASELEVGADKFIGQYVGFGPQSGRRGQNYRFKSATRKTLPLETGSASFNIKR